MQNLPQGVDDSCQQQQFQILLTRNQLNNKVKKYLKVALNVNIAAFDSTDNAIGIIDNRINAINNLINESAKVNVEEDIVDVQNYVKDDKRLQLLSKNLNTLEQSFSNAKANSEI